MINVLFGIFDIWTNFKILLIYTLLIDIILVKDKTNTNKYLIKINDSINNLTKLLHFIWVKRLTNLYIIAHIKILQFIMLMI